MDPFLSGINEQHARQESADSGLGLGTTYSLPHTPEDFLANIDDNMDGTSGKSGLRKNVSDCETFPAIVSRYYRTYHRIYQKNCAKKNVRLICQRIFNSRFMNNYFARLQKGTVR